MRSRVDSFADAIMREAGKPISIARGEVMRCLDTFTDAALAARSLSGAMEPLAAAPSGQGRLGIVRRFPVGPVAGISPFNFPLNLVAHKVAPAIASGCPLVLKPSSQTPTSALLLASLLREAGLPEGALSVLPMSHSIAGPLTDDARLKLLSFTGSPEVGWDLKQRARHMKVLLELGGNAGNIVCKDADLSLAVQRLAVGAFAYAGQSCISVQRIFVHSSIVDAFTQAFVQHTREQIAYGDPSDERVLVGPLISIEDALRVESWIQQACSSGAHLACGGTRSDAVIAPTILTGCDADLPIMCQEVFGPVASIVPFDDLETAFSRVNDSPFGLQAGIFTQNIDNVFSAHERLEVGGVMHNESSAFRVDLMPYGGVKQSGTGREGPRHAVYEYTEPRILVIRRGLDV
jgi:glyceraldehyde-3-phosphate dehydrogenase (NADP+)